MDALSEAVLESRRQRCRQKAKVPLRSLVAHGQKRHKQAQAEASVQQRAHMLHADLFDAKRPERDRGA